MYKFENCANSVESCIEAQKASLDRVELCAGIPEGGTTPSYGDIVMARRVLTTTKLHVIIRPRGGDFLYSDLEREIMLEDVRMARRLGVDGVVFGVLTSDGDIDMDYSWTSADLLKLQQHFFEINVLSDMEFTLADNDKNGVVDSTDILTLQTKILGVF